jgi:hypothetical protein
MTLSGLPNWWVVGRWTGWRAGRRGWAPPRGGFARPQRFWLVAGWVLCAWLALAAPVHACVSDAECDDGLACNGMETCDSNNTCQPGTPPTCTLGGADPQCNDAACVEPTGCVVTPRIDGFGCEDNDVCTTHDICMGGVCVGTDGGDSDGDGFCDAQEVQAQCNPNDPAEIPAQPNVYSGGRGNSGGEILLTFRAPADRDVSVATNAICTTAGQCDLASGLCASGKVADTCTLDSDCDQPPSTCRIVANFGGVPDLGLQLPGDRKSGFEVGLKVAGIPLIDLTPDFLPVTPGCTRKVDVTLPGQFKRATMRFRIRGTTAGRRRTDRDRIRFTP